MPIQPDSSASEPSDVLIRQLLQIDEEIERQRLLGTTGPIQVPTTFDITAAQTQKKATKKHTRTKLVEPAFAM